MKIVLSILAALVIVAGGVGVAALLLLHPKTVKKEERVREATLVEVVRAGRADHPVRVTAMGEVTASRRVALVPEVSGRTRWVHPRLVPGGQIEEGMELLRIDPRDYEAAIRQRKSELVKARFELKVEMGRQVIARDEWKLLNDEAKEEDGGAGEAALALRKPHLDAAKAAVAAAESRLAQAELNLERTTLAAPFNAAVETESAEVGKVVGRGTTVAMLVGTDVFWIRAALPVDRLGRITLPDAEGEGGASATIRQEVGREAWIEREGRVVRLLPDLDERGRLARVLVAVRDPLGVEKDGAFRRKPLLLGSYVRVEIAGRPLRGVIAVPRQALRENDRVYVAGKENRLEIRPVRVIWREKETVFLESGVEAGERIVLTRLTAPVPGMRLETKNVADDNRSGEPSAGDDGLRDAPFATAEGATGRTDGDGRRHE